MNARKCPVCGNPLSGRIDKKYCSDQCRYMENNKNKYQAERPILETNKALRKNRSILKTLCPVGKATVRREVLDAMGYDITVFSSLFLTTKKQIYYLCYDYGFTPVIEKGVEKALNITKQPYMNSWNPWKFVKTNDTGEQQSTKIIK
jgi:predicted nucleic acid-binding Zn ribbon protein